MKYIYECHFTDKPECSKCMLSRPSGKDLEGENVVGCSALSSMPKCPEEGARKDCPLKEYAN